MDYFLGLGLAAMILALVILSSAPVFIASAFFAALYHMRIFQQNGYRTGAQLKWLIKKPKELAPFFATALIFLIDAESVALFVALPFLAVYANFCAERMRKTPVKKPLKYTARVARMFTVIGAAFVCAAVTPFTFESRFYFLTPELLFVITPLLPILANAVCAPVEAAVRRYYAADAKKILKSCPGLVIIGVTGSYGKTSVKYFLTALLNGKYNTLMTPESYNTPMGVVKTVREGLRGTADVFVCEMGARRQGDIKALCGIVNPTLGIITSIGSAHLETFKNIETTVKTKFELADAVNGKNGIMFLNGDNEYIRENLPAGKHITYGLNKKNACFAYDVDVSENGTEFCVNCGGETVTGLRTRLLGEHNVINLTGAVALAMHLGVSADDIKRRIRKIEGPPHRLQLIKTPNAVIIDDAYNSNPEGASAALSVLSFFGGVKILVTPGMVELGAESEARNFAFGKQAARICDYVVLVGEKRTKAIFNGLSEAKFDKTKIHTANTTDAAIAYAYALETNGRKIILIENDLPENY